MNELHQTSAAAGPGAALNLATNAQQKSGVIRSLKSNITAPTTDAGPTCQLSSEAAAAIANAQLNQLVAPKVPAGQRRIIKKITIIDPKKLQQAGLDRQIAEILSKQKLAGKQGTSSKAAPTVKSATVLNVPSRSQPKSLNTANTSEERCLEQLSPVDRLKHAKKLLNQKLLTRASTSPTSPLPTAPKTIKLPTLNTTSTTQHKSLSPQNPAPKTKQYLVLKMSPEEENTQKRSAKKVTEPKSWPAKSPQTPPKTAQDIARVLDFSGFSNSDKTPVKTPQFIHNFNLHKLNSSIQKHREPQQLQENCLKSNENVLHSHSKNGEHFFKTYQKKLPSAAPVEDEKDDVIPKASIRKPTASSTVPRSPPSHVSVSTKSTSLDLSSQPQSESLDLPKCSPLKMPFPTSTLPQEAPLPTISTFKRPFPVQRLNSPVNVSINYAVESFSLTQSKSQSHSLIVLEDKVLSQDEKIDLTVLGLTEPKMEPTSSDPSFVCTKTFGLPSPEKVVIKEEKPEEVALPAIGATVSTDPNQGLVVVNVMQPKKFIVAPDKLKLSKDKIAALAKKIKSQAALKTQQKKTVSDRKEDTSISKDSQKQSYENERNALNSVESIVAPGCIDQEPSSPSDNSYRQTTSKKVEESLPQTEEIPNNIIIEIVKEDAIVDLKNLPEEQSDSEQRQTDIEKPLVLLQVENVHTNGENCIPSELPKSDVEEPLNSIEVQNVQANGEKPSSSEPMQIELEKQLDLSEIQTIQNHAENSSTSEAMTNYEKIPSECVDVAETPSIVDKSRDLPTPESTSNVNVIESITREEPHESPPLETSVGKLLVDDEQPSTSKNCKSSLASKTQPAVCILDETPPSEVISAVDFLAAFAFNTHSNLELSADEMNLNASLEMNLPTNNLSSSSVPASESVSENVLSVKPIEDPIDATKLLAQMFGERIDTPTNKELSKSSSIKAKQLDILQNTGNETFLEIDKKKAELKAFENPVEKEWNVEPVDMKGNDNPVEKESNVIPVEKEDIQNSADKQIAGSLLEKESNEIPVEIESSVIPVEKEEHQNPAEKKSNIIPFESIVIPLAKEVDVVSEEKERNNIVVEMKERKIISLEKERNDIPTAKGISDIYAPKNMECDKEKQNQPVSTKSKVQENIEKLSSEALQKENNKVENPGKELQTPVSQSSTELAENMTIETEKIPTEELKELVEESKVRDQPKNNELNSEGKPTIETSTKRIPRFKKGKINLVPRRKQSIASTIESDKTKTNAPLAEPTKETETSEITIATNIDQKTKEVSEQKNVQDDVSETLNVSEVISNQIEKNKKQILVDSLKNVEDSNTSTVILDATQRTKDAPFDSQEIEKETIIHPTSIDLNLSSVDVEPVTKKSIPPSVTPRRKTKTKISQKLEEPKEIETPVSPSVSLINPPKDSEEKKLEPPKIPFKRKSLETKMKEENVVGIKNLLKQIDANQLEKDSNDKTVSKKVVEKDKTSDKTEQKVQGQEEVSDNIEIGIKETNRRKSTRRTAELKGEEKGQFSNKDTSVAKNQVESSQKKSESSNNNDVESRTEMRQTRRSKSRTVEREMAVRCSKVEEESTSIILQTPHTLSDKIAVGDSAVSALLEDSKAKSATVSRISKQEPLENQDIGISKPAPAKKPRLESKHSADTQSDIDITDVDCSNMESYDETAKEESSQELMTTKPSRKRLRKTVDGFKRRRILSTESDSDEENRSIVNEDSNDFLGFDEAIENQRKIIENFKVLIATTSANSGDEQKGNNKSTVATKEKISLEKSFTSKIEKKSPRGGRAVTMPLKKRWELAHKPQEETDITDDTSPLDDDEDDACSKVNLKALTGNTKSNSKDTKTSARKRKLNTSESENVTREAKKTKVSQEERTVEKKTPSSMNKQFSANSPDHVFVEPQPVSTLKTNGLSSDIDIAQVKEKTQKSFETKDSLNDTCKSETSTVLGSSGKGVLEVNISFNKRAGRKAKTIFNESISSSTPIQTTPSGGADLKTTTTSTVETTPVSRKRGRRSIKEETLEDSSISVAENSTVELDQTATTPVAKKRGRKPKAPNDSANNSILDIGTPNSTIDESIGTPMREDNSITTDSTQKKRGRKPKFGGTPGAQSNEDKFNPRLLLIRSRDQLDTDEQLTETTEKPAAGFIKCGLCLANTTKAKWNLHLGEHYGVGWVHGQKELDTSSRSVILGTMINYYKQTKVKGLNCRLCQRLYRSGLGLLTHIEACGLSAEEQQKNRLECEYCKNSYTKLSLPVHIRTCPVRIASIKETLDTTENTTENSSTDVLNNVGRVKRASLLQAQSKLKAIGEAIQEEFNANDHLKFIDPPNKENNRKTFLADIEKFGKIFCTQRLCKFFCSDVDAMEAHLDSCKYIPKPGYHCTICNKPSAVFPTEERALKHVNRNHKSNATDFEGDSSECNINSESESSDDDFGSGVDSNDDEPDGEGEGGTRKKSKKSNKKSQGRFRSGKQLFPMRSANVKDNVVRKWKQFTTQNYSGEVLFDYATPTYTLHQNTDDSLKGCLPRQEESMKFTFENSSNIKKTFGAAEILEWNQLQRFETTKRNKSELYAFIGAPVKAIAWAPIPKISNAEQFLVVCYRKDIDKYSRCVSPKIAPTLLVVYKVNSGSEPNMCLHYAIRVPDGPVHCIEFLPSGGYDEASNRLGLLAVGSIKSDIRIYSLPLKIENDSNISENLIILDLNPVLTLTTDLNSLNQSEISAMDPQCMALKWSEFLGHNYIFAGFSNGYLGIWDISEDEHENLNRFVVNGMRHFVPTTYFFCGERAVRSMALHYDSLGPRWLAVATLARKLNFYDVRDLGNPLIVREETPKNIIMSMDWPVMWEPIALSMGDAILNNGECVYLRNPMSVNFVHSRIEHMLSGVTQVKYNPWQSVFASATENGDLLFNGARELHFEVNISKSKGKPKAISTMEVKCLNGEPMPKRLDKKSVTNSECAGLQMYEGDYKDKYGLVFGQVVKFKDEHMGASKSKDRLPPPNIIRYTRINALSCNLNANACQLVAYGYDNGFLRILNFNRSEYFN